MSYKVYARHGGAAGASQDDITARVPAFDENVPLIQMGMSCQTGSASQGSFIVPDPVGNLDASLYFPPHTQITWTEDASGDELWLARGRISRWSVGRPDYKPPADSVEWNITVDDANVDLRGLAFTEDWVRPAETGTARLYALAPYTLNGASSTRPDHDGVISYRPSTVITISSSHLAPDTETTVMPAKTYQVDTQPLDVVSDCAETEGKTFGVVIHHTAGTSHLCLKYTKATDYSTYASPCKISDDLADWDPDDLTAPVFEPIYDQGDAQQVDGNAYLSGIVSRYGPDDQAIVLLDATAGDDNEYWVEAVQDGRSVDPTQAAARAASIIAYRRPYAETDACSIYVLAEQVHLVEAGMSIQIKAAPINASITSTIGSYIDRQIVVCQKEPLPDGRYHVILQLNRPNRAPGSGALQPVSTTPQPAPDGGCIDSFSRTVLQGAWGTGEWNVPWQIVVTPGGGAGDDALAPNHFSVDSGMGLYDLNEGFGEPVLTTVAAQVERTWTLPATMEVRGQIRDDGAYAMLRDTDWDVLLTGNCLLSAEPTTSDIFTFIHRWTFGAYHILYYACGGNPNPSAATWEAWLCTDLSAVNPVYGTGHPADPGVDCTFINSWEVEMSTVSGWYCSGATVLFDASLHVLSPRSAWGGKLSIVSTGVFAQAWGPDGISPVISIVDTPVAPSVINFSPTKGLPMVIAADIIQSSGDCAGVGPYFAYLDDPRFGAIPTEYDLGLGDGAQTVYFVSPAPYVPGSLRVWVDGLEQTAAISESDPTTGEFTFSFAPLATEQIRVWYQNG